VSTTDSIFFYKNSFDEGRISRLNLAYDIWKTKYKGASMFFGHGFKYYDWYTEKYPNDKGLSDYPHNPFISVLFYSGIIGLVLFLWFIYKTLIMYLKHLNRFFLFFVCFIITMFFSFFSGSSPFDPPIMGFFMLLPYYLNFLVTNNSRIEVSPL